MSLDLSLFCWEVKTATGFNSNVIMLCDKKEVVDVN